MHIGLNQGDFFNLIQKVPFVAMNPLLAGHFDRHSSNELTEEATTEDFSAVQTWLKLGAFFTTDSKAGIQPDHAARLRKQLTALNAAKSADDMAVPSWKLPPLKGDLAGHYTVTVNANWRHWLAVRQASESSRHLNGYAADLFEGLLLADCRHRPFPPWLPTDGTNARRCPSSIFTLPLKVLF